MGKRILVTNVNDVPHYQEGLLVFAESLVQNAPDERLYVVTINCDESYAEKVKKIGPQIQVKSIQVENCGAVCRVLNKHKTMRRMMEWHEMVGWLDGDMIVRKPMDDFWAGVETDVLKIWHKTERKIKDEKRFQAGSYAIGDGENTREWLNCVISEQEKEVAHPGSAEDGKGSPCWMHTQGILYWCYLKSKVKHVQLPESCNDSFFNKGSTIWHCKSNHFHEKRYQKEYKRYLECVKKKVSL